MKTKKKTRTLALLLSLILLLGACGQTADERDKRDSDAGAGDSQQKENGEQTDNEPVDSETGYPEYLNLDSAYPIIKDEYEGTIKLKVAMVVNPETGEWENLWISKYLKDKYNIELDVEYIPSSAQSEKRSLMLNSGELPDMIWNMSLSTTDLVKYGQMEGLFLACDEYMDEALTPNILHYWTDDVRKICSAPDGHVYSLPKVNATAEEDYGYMPRMYINKAWLDGLHIEMPRTLDEFVDAMYAIKEADPAGVGSENLYPFGGGMTSNTLAWYLLNALGYGVPDDTDYGNLACLRDGEVVIPVYDMEVYKEFLKLMNQFWNDGIIDPNYFTMEATEINAQMNSGQTATYGDAPFISGISTWNEWDACYPLTSEWQTEPEVARPQTAFVGNCVISADTEYPELCMRLVDIFYNNETDCSAALWGGVPEGTEYAYDGYVLLGWDEEKRNFVHKDSEYPEEWKGNIWGYHLAYLNGIMPNFGAFDMHEAWVKLAADFGYDMPAKGVLDPSVPDDYWRLANEKNVQYLVDAYPRQYYVAPETSEQIRDLKTVIDPYVKEQVARFITGNRPLSETADFVKELETMGMEDLLNLYKDIYTVYNR